MEVAIDKGWCDQSAGRINLPLCFAFNVWRNSDNFTLLAGDILREVLANLR